MSKRQNSHSVRTAALCCSQRARNAISPLSPLGRIARIADSNCPSRRRELHKIHLSRHDGSHVGEPGNPDGVQSITDVMIGRPAPLLGEEFELGIMIARATEEMDGSD